jgi:hypothetical protein
VDAQEAADILGVNRRRNGDLREIGSPPIRGLSYTFRKSPVAYDCVVGPGEVATLRPDNDLQKGAGD